jgi:hypothetical protein
MKRIMWLKKKTGGEESQVIDISLVRANIQKTEDGRQRIGMSVRETTRIHALTGVPWEEINREAERYERV